MLKKEKEKYKTTKYSGFATSFCRSGICKQAEKGPRRQNNDCTPRPLLYINVCRTDKAALFPIWVRYIPAYLPFNAISSSWVPFSAIRPSSISRMRSESRMVESRWAIIKEVRPRVMVSMARRIRCSVTVSTELVASSRIRIGASCSMARAMVRSWRSLAPGAAPPWVKVSYHSPGAAGG